MKNEILGGVNNNKDIKKNHMESYHCRSFLSHVCTNIKTTKMEFL